MSTVPLRQMKTVLVSVAFLYTSKVQIKSMPSEQGLASFLARVLAMVYCGENGPARRHLGAEKEDTKRVAQFSFAKKNPLFPNN